MPVAHAEFLDFGVEFWGLQRLFLRGRRRNPSQIVMYSVVSEVDQRGIHTEGDTWDWSSRYKRTDSVVRQILISLPYRGAKIVDLFPYRWRYVLVESALNLPLERSGRIKHVSQLLLSLSGELVGLETSRPASVSN